MRPVIIIALAIFLQTVCVGANFSTLEFYGNSLGADGVLIGLLWLGLTAPRAVLSPFWGSLSDKWGRKPLMVIGGLGTIAGSVLFAVAGSYWVLLLSRLVDSVLSAQATIAFAIVADSTPTEKRAAGMGIVGAAVMLGFTAGPVVGALMGEFVSFSALGWLMAGLQTLGLAIILIGLPETKSREHAPGSELVDAGSKGWRIPLERPTVGMLLLVSFIMTLGYTNFNTALPDAMKMWFGWGQHRMMYPWMVLGLVGGLVQGGVVRRLVPSIGERRTILLGIGLMVASFILMAAKGSAGLMLFSAGLLAAGGGLAIPTIGGLLSHQLRQDEQGLVLGMNQTAQGVGRGLGPLIGSLFAGHLLRFSFVTAAAILLLSWLLMARVRPGESV